MKHYITDVQLLRSEVKLEDVIDYWQSTTDEGLPTSHTPVSLKLGKDPRVHTLQDLEKLRIEFFSEFRASLSGISSLILHEVRRGSVEVVWGVLRVKAEVLNKEMLMDNNREFFERFGVQQVSMHNSVPYKNCESREFGACSNKL